MLQTKSCHYNIYDDGASDIPWKTDIMKILSFGSLHYDSTGNSKAANGRMTGDKLKMMQKGLCPNLGVQLALAWRD